MGNNEKLLLKISIFVSLTGIIILFFVLKNIQPYEITANNIHEYVGKEVSMKGDIISSSNFEKVVMLKVKTDTIIDVLFFKKNKLEIPNGSVTIVGELIEEDNKFKIISSSIKYN